MRSMLLVLVATLVLSACATQPGVTSTAGEPNSTVDSPSTTTRLPRDELSPPTEDDLREIADFMGLDDPPTDVAFERYISPDEYGDVMVPCLTDQGILARHSGDGGVLYGDIPPEQAILQREASYRCHVRFPIHPMYNEPLSAEQMRRLYDYLVDDLTPCLEAERYTVPSPPTFEVFIASHNDPEAAPWHPYPASDPRIQQPAEWDRMNGLCPQNPPLDVLYGDR